MSTPDAFDRLTTRIGDLDHPLYAEERQRDVWNEASAVGFQLLLWALLVAAVVSVWVGGADAVPYTLGMTLPIGLASIVAVSYAARRGVDLRAAGILDPVATVATAVRVGLSMAIEAADCDVLIQRPVRLSQADIRP